MPRPRTGLLELRAGVWYARLSIPKPGGGRDRPWFCLNTGDEVEAQRRLDALIAKTFGPEEQRPRRFTEYARAWLEARIAAGVAQADSEKSWIERYMVPILGDMLLGDVKPLDARKVITAAKEAGLARQTIVHIRATGRRIFEQARMDELVAENPFDKAPAPKERELRIEREKRGLPARAKREREILADEEILRLIGCADVDLEIRLLSLAARAEGGMRTRDLTAWAWPHLDLPGLAWCVVPRTKTAKPQKLEIPDILSPSIRAWWEKAGKPTKGPVFPVTRGDRKGEARKTRGVSFAKRLRRALLVAGISRLPLVKDAHGRPAPDPRDPLFFPTEQSLPVDFHSFRRAFGTALANAGIPDRDGMRLGGWSDPKAYQRYLMTADAAKKIPAAALPAQPKSATPSTPKEMKHGQDGAAVAELAQRGIALAGMAEAWDAAEALVEGEEGTER